MLMKDVEEAAHIHYTVHTAAEAMVKQLTLGCGQPIQRIKDNDRFNSVIACLSQRRSARTDASMIAP